MSETDDQTPRRPPTIELSATELDGAAEKTAESEAAATDTAAGEAANADASAPSSRRRGGAALILSALLGTLLTAAAAAALWFTGAIPAHDTTPAAAPSSKASGPAVPEPNPPSDAVASSPPAAASNEPNSPAASNSPAAADLIARLDKLDRAIEAQRSDPALGSKLAEIAAQTKSLADNLTALTRRVDEAAAASQSAGKQAGTALGAAEAAKSASEAASKDQVHREDVDALTRRITALESAVKDLAAATAPLAAAGANDRAARLSIAADALRAAVERGAPYQAELSAVQSLGVEQKATAALEPFAATGVPSSIVLARELAGLIPSLQDAAEPRSGDTSFVERLKNNAQKLVRITPLNAPPGNEPQAALDRIRLDAARGDIGAALSDLNALPEAAKSLAGDWSKKAANREAALAASRKIAADTLAALAQSSPR